MRKHKAIFQGIFIFFLGFFMFGCVHMRIAAEREPIALSFEAIIVQNKDKVGLFHCRPLFVKGTAQGLPSSDFSDMAMGKKPVAMIGIMKNMEDMQKELIICGLMNPIAAGRGTVSELGEMTMRLPLLDMRKPVTIRMGEKGLSFSAMPCGMPDLSGIKLKDGESLLLAWFDKNRQLTLVRWTRINQLSNQSNSRDE